MKRKILAYAACVAAMTMLVGCSGGKISNDLITINKYKGLEVEKVTVAEVTDEDVEQSIQSTLQSLGTKEEITDRVSQEGDIVTVDFVGKMDGVAFDGGSANDQTITLGAGNYIDGFEEGIIGHSKGEVFDINVTFPENYGSTDLAGKDAVFTITLDKIEVLNVPELTDELVTSKLSTTAKTVEEYKQEEKEALILSNEQSAESQLTQNVWTALLEQCEVEEFPEDDLEAMIEEIETQYSTIATMAGTDVATFVEYYYGLELEEMAKNLLVQRYAIELISEKENLTLTVEDYENDLAEYAERWGYTAEDMEEEVGHDELEKMFLQNRVGDWLVENCKQSE